MNCESQSKCSANVKAQEMLAVPGQGWPLTVRSEMASPEEQTPLASGCNRCLLDAFVPPAYPEPKTELMTDAQDLPRDLCTGLRLIIALTLVTPFTEQETEAKKREGRPFSGPEPLHILAHVMFSTVLVSRTNCPQFEDAVK